MEVMNTRRIKERLDSYAFSAKLNTLLGVGISAPVSVDNITFDKPEEVEKLAKAFQASIKSDSFGYSDDESLIAAIVLLIAQRQLKLKSGQMPFPPAIMNDIIKEGRVFHEGAFADNPYLANVHFDDCRSGAFRLTRMHFAKYEPFMYSTPKCEYGGIMVPRIGVFDHEFSFPCIREKQYMWMSVTPNEIATMAGPIEEARGRVLTLGCGLGYFAYMAARKEDVERVTVIEKEPAVIELFNKYILPQFDCRDKIELIQADAFDYLKTLEDGRFDTCFADILPGNTDSAAYVRLKQALSKFREMKVSCWIEDTMAAALMGYVYMIISQAYGRSDGSPVYTKNAFRDKDREVIEYLQNLLKDKKITTPEEVDYYMDSKNILALMG